MSVFCVQHLQNIPWAASVNISQTTGLLGQLIPATLHPGKTNKPSQISTFSTEPHTQGASANTESAEHYKESTADESKGFIFSGSAIGATYLPVFKNTPEQFGVIAFLLAFPQPNSLRAHCLRHGTRVSNHWISEQPWIMQELKFLQLPPFHLYETELMITAGKTLNQILAKVSPGNKKDLRQTWMETRVVPQFQHNCNSNGNRSFAHWCHEIQLLKTATKEDVSKAILPTWSYISFLT